MRLSTLLAVLALCGCSRSDQGGKTSAPAPVHVATVERKTMPIEVRVVGTVEPIKSVSVLPQVRGEITKVHFAEGDTVSEDQLLFTIDTRPYRASLSEASARVAKDEALLNQARDRAARADKLKEQGLISAQKHEDAQADLASLEATLRADRAALAGASLDVDLATIRSPIAGRTGSLLVDAGNVVKEVDKPLVVIRQMAPIYVRFAAPEQFLAQVRERMAAEPLKVLAQPRGHSGTPAEGTLTFIDNGVDPATGTITMKATFENGDQLLWPGQFVDVRLRLGTQPGALVVPEQAVQAGQDGDHLFVVTDANKAELRTVKVQRQLGTELVLSSGVSPGERVVTQGQVRLTPGAEVQVLADAPAASATAQASSAATPQPSAAPVGSSTAAASATASAAASAKARAAASAKASAAASP